MMIEQKRLEEFFRDYGIKPTEKHLHLIASIRTLEILPDGNLEATVFDLTQGYLHLKSSKCVVEKRGDDKYGLAYNRIKILKDNALESVVLNIPTLKSWKYFNEGKDYPVLAGARLEIMESMRIVAEGRGLDFAYTNGILNKFQIIFYDRQKSEGTIYNCVAVRGLED